MVLRSSDAPRAATDRVAAHDVQLDELARAQARGAQALRNDAGHILNLNPESPNPLLVPTGGNSDIDSALKFQNGGLEVRSPDGDSFRDLGARGGFFRGDLSSVNLSTSGGIESQGRIHTAFELRADQGIRAEGGLSSGGDTTVGGNFLVGFRARATNWSSSVYDGCINWDPAGTLAVMNYAGNAYKGVFASGFSPPPSWRAYKQDQRPLADYLGVSTGELIDRLDVNWSWTYNPSVVSFADGRERIGPKLDEVPEGLIIRSTDSASGEDRSSWDLTGMVTVLLAEVQALRKRVASLEGAA